MEFINKMVNHKFFKYAVGVVLILIAYAVHLTDSNGALNYLKVLFGL